MRHWYKCNECSFQLQTGHNHHEGASQTICMKCGQLYLNVPANPWGPENTELCSLLKVEAASKKKKSTTNTDSGQKVLARNDMDHPFRVGNTDYYFIVYDMLNLVCDRCHSSGTITDDLAADMESPECRKGRIVDMGFIEF